jgi:hypothetical protein
VLRVVIYVGALAVLVPPPGVLAGISGLWPGEPGAAVARLLLILFPCWIYFRWTREVAGIPFYRRAWAYLSGLGLMLGVFHALRAGAEMLGTEGWWAALPAAVAALGLYLAYLPRVHPGTAENLRYTRALASPMAFIRFLRDGLRGPGRP